MPNLAPKIYNFPDWTAKYPYVHKAKNLATRFMKREIKRNALFAVISGLAAAAGTGWVGKSLLASITVAIVVAPVTYGVEWLVCFVKWYVIIPRKEVARLQKRAIPRPAQIESTPAAAEPRLLLPDIQTPSATLAEVVPHPIKVEVAEGDPRTYQDETYRVIRAKIDNPLGQRLVVKIQSIETKDEGDNVFPEVERDSCPWPVEESRITEGFNMHTGGCLVLADLFAQSVTTKKIYVCVPYEGGRAEKFKGIWCKLTVESPPGVAPVKGELSFWLWVDEEGDLVVHRNPKREIPNAIATIAPESAIQAVQPQVEILDEPVSSAGRWGVAVHNKSGSTMSIKLRIRNAVLDTGGSDVPFPHAEIKGPFPTTGDTLAYQVFHDQAQPFYFVTQSLDNPQDIRFAVHYPAFSDIGATAYSLVLDLYVIDPLALNDEALATKRVELSLDDNGLLRLKAVD